MAAEIEVAVAATRMAAVDEADVLVGVDQDVVECRVAVNSTRSSPRAWSASADRRCPPGQARVAVGEMFRRDAPRAHHLARLRQGGSQPVSSNGPVVHRKRVERKSPPQRRE